ncbi:uncharacterized protein LOC110006600 [Amborella trichopoda]|uniref:uncharacterized protein LOC110006600 n=1 Tax=Amborella trichopoda TaxID=13333 RepID=UPI0009BFC675|nr:uncharacterized protein LOC110006600 [Amborella trichopoda]|eukprot:XP_020518242.1 uncharacterized protein LOC110006600 [Amborella trichopoda]
MIVVISTCHGVGGRANSGNDLEAKAEAHLKLLNKPAIKTIKSEDGDVIDCVDIYKQPAFDNPLLRNHTIQVLFYFLFAFIPCKLLFIWNKHESCPQGTIPIRRTTKNDILRAKSITNFGKKTPNSIPGPKKSDNNSAIDVEQAYVYVSDSKSNYFGAEANINVWNPSVKKADGFE